MATRGHGFPIRDQRGQVLVIIAISVTVLILFVALAVDVGSWYGQRRSMQNAADAGALAGAYELCLGTPSLYESAADDYARRNGAEFVAVRRVDSDGTSNPTSGTTVVVSATVKAPTFFSRLILPDSVDVSAVGAAACGQALTGCGALPVAFDVASYESMPCSTFDGSKFTDYDARSTFVLWASDNDKIPYDTLCDMCNCGGIGNYLYDDFIMPWLTPSTQVTAVVSGTVTTKSLEAWETLPDPVRLIMGGSPMLPGNRGWLALGLNDLPLSEEAQADSDCTDSCGADALRCWLRYGYPGQIGGSDPKMWLQGNPGIKQSDLEAAKLSIENEIHSFVLYDVSTKDSVSISHNCSDGGGGTKFGVVGTGCGLVLEVINDSDLGITMDIRSDYVCTSNGNPPPKCPECPDKERGILVTKVCDCPVGECTGTAGEPIGESAPGAVSLVSSPNVTW